MKKTKILATIGPASNKVSVLKKLFNAGVNGIRLNTAHGDFKQYQLIINRARSIKDIPIVLDIKGPELRIRVKKEIYVKKGQELVIGFDSKKEIYFDYNITKKVKIGDKVFFDSGGIRSKIVKKTKNNIRLRFYDSGYIKNSKGVNIPTRMLDLPALSRKDKVAIKFANKNKVSFIALSFTRSANDVKRLKKLIHPGCHIIAKIESREGIENIDEIIKEADAVMVARGDLGVEVSVERIPELQKKIINSCNKAGKLVITATQMLESMIKSNTPTRAEVSDVANAILDGSDCLMLSAETAIGSYPVETINVMRKVALKTEINMNPNEFDVGESLTEMISRNTFELAETKKVDKIITFTERGYTARMISRFKPKETIIAVTTNDYTRKHLELQFGVLPLYSKTISLKIKPIARFCLKKKVISKNERVLFTNLVSLNRQIELVQSIRHISKLI